MENKLELRRNNSEMLLTTSDLSIYRDELVTKENWALGVARIKRAFPELEEGWFLILKDRVKEKGFTNRQFADAVNNLVDTCVYPRPTIANILSWDRKIKTYTYNELVSKYPEIYIRSGKDIMMMGNIDPIKEDYAEINIEGEKRYVKKEHKKHFGG